MFMNKELQEAVFEYHNAQEAFNYAEQDYFEAANARLTSAKARLDAVLKNLKKGEVADA